MPSALPLLFLFISSSFCLLSSISVSLLMQQNKILTPLLFTQIQSSVLQPPPTEEHRQRVRSMMEALQTPSKSCSPSPPSNVLYPWHSELYKTHTGWHIVCIMQAHALSPIHQLQLTLQKPHTCLCKYLTNVVKAATHTLCTSNVSRASPLTIWQFLECLCCAFHLISLRASCTSQGRYCISELALKGSVHLSSWLTLSRTRAHTQSSFHPPTHTLKFAACSVWYSFSSAFIESSVVISHS